jgi:hypothetical protein
MKLHSDVLTVADLHDALRVTGLSARGVYLDDSRPISEGRSRKRARRITFYLVADSGHGRRWANSGSHGAGHDKAATWHEWGALLGELFHRDPEAVTDYYSGASDFEASAVRPHATPPDEKRTVQEWRTMFVREAVSR